MATVAEPFVGRQPELANLKQFLKKKTASLIVMRGRRRIGKKLFTILFALYPKI